jgi:hypothetical protein
MSLQTWKDEFYPVPASEPMGGYKAQIEHSLRKMIAKPEDHDFFRAILGIKAEESTSADFSLFVAKLLRAKAPCTTNP